MISLKKTNEEIQETNGNVPNNLPHENSDSNLDFHVTVSKSKLKTVLKVLIILVIILVSAPRIINNVTSTTEVVLGEANKFPQVFPSLTYTGTTVGSFFYDQVKDFGTFISENLASVAELLYSRKLGPNEQSEEILNLPEEEIAKPVRIIIDKVGIDSTILNPESTDTDVLDGSLAYGVVRYPKSGLLGEDDNVYLFGHSTSIKVVRNQAYKALNGLGDLETGDIIKVQSENKEHIYRVTSVEMKKNSDATVEFNTGKRTLTISTCNTLGAKEDRFIVKADFVTSYPLTSVTIESNEENNTNNSGNTNSTGSTGSGTTTLTPGNETTTTITVPSTGTNSVINSNPYGKVDLVPEIMQVGIIDPLTDEFVATTTFTTISKIAVKFKVTNKGDKTAEGWSFNMVLPTYPQYIYQSNTQQNLRPGERIEYAISFDKPEENDKALIILNADPTRSIYESNETNNIITKSIEIVAYKFQ